MIVKDKYIQKIVRVFFDDEVIPNLDQTKYAIVIVPRPTHDRPITLYRSYL